MALVYMSTGTGFCDPGRPVAAGIGVAAKPWDGVNTIWLVLLVVVPFAALISRRCRRPG